MTEAKAEVRRKMLLRRKKLANAEVMRASREVCQRLTSIPEVMAAQMLALYVAFAGEIDLKEFFLTSKRQGKDILLPRYSVTAGCYEMVIVQDIENDTIPAHYGIREPLPERLALREEEWIQDNITWLVPGTAFTPRGDRLGQGGGFYDRLLRSANGFKIGVCHDWQLVPELPCNDRDIPMDSVITDRRFCRRSELCAGAHCVGALS